MNFHSQKILLSPLFLFSLIVLLLNDHYLKAQFHNFLTGKLSDFAGLFIFPLFFAAFFPKRRLSIYFFAGFFFVFWKSPLSQSFLICGTRFNFSRLEEQLTTPTFWLCRFCHFHFCIPQSKHTKHFHHILQGTF